MICFLPVLAILYVHSIQTPWHYSVPLDGVSAEVQTCRDGFGARLAFSEQFVQAGPQYGYTIPLDDRWSVTFNVHGGLGYSNTVFPLSGRRQITLYNGGASLSLNRDRYSVKCGYDHMSNGTGGNDFNAGQDLISCGAGVKLW